MNKKVCKYHFASYLKVPFPGAENKFPECTFKDEPSNCPACPHQDFSTWAKKDLQHLLTQAKNDFSASATWSSIYTGMVAAIEKLP
jgi:predicted metal-binding protein